MFVLVEQFLSNIMMIEKFLSNDNSELRYAYLGLI